MLRRLFAKCSLCRNVSNNVCENNSVNKNIINNDHTVVSLETLKYIHMDMEYLEKINYENTVPFVPLIVGGKVVKVYDGDTFTIASKLPYLHP
jgi:endonuclease YncB( thermonuclease family)